MNKQDLINLVGQQQYDNIEKLGQERERLVKEMLKSIPAGVKIQSVNVGLDGDDFIKNEFSMIVRYKIQG